MEFTDTYRRVTERIDIERGLLLVLIVSSAYMIWESYNFSIQSAARFPRITAGAVLVGALLLFFRNYLPGPVRSFVAEEMEMFEADEEIAEREEQVEAERGEPDDTQERTISTVGRPIDDSLFTGLSAIGYGLLGYAIGILWASPLFVLVYTIWFRRPWYQVIVLPVIGFLIAYGFMSVLGVPMDQGELFLQEGI